MPPQMAARWSGRAKRRAIWVSHEISTEIRKSASFWGISKPIKGFPSPTILYLIAFQHLEDNLNVLGISGGQTISGARNLIGHNLNPWYGV
jgi:hypothetical protein